MKNVISTLTRLLMLISTMDKLFQHVHLLLILCSCVAVPSEGCSVGWFGSKCQYQCHCKNNMACDVNGQCAAGCDIGWFGTGCQYVDLARLPEVSVTIAPRQKPTWLLDGDDTTCNEDGNFTSLQISWNTSYPFTWLRMKVNYTSLKYLIVDLTFTTSKNDISNCINQQVSILDNTTVDYRCDMNETVTQLKMEGPALKSLCSLYISGGRNVALHQSAEQTSTWTEYDSRTNYYTICYASLAVDGKTDCYILNGSSSHTKDEPNQSWSLTLDTPKAVNRYVLYNRADCCYLNRLNNFILTSFDINNNILWAYQDQSPNASLIYTFAKLHNNTVSKIQIRATSKQFVKNDYIVTLCEVFMYGECTPGIWGLDCKQKCPEECPGWCQQDTGKCLSCLGRSDPPQCNKVCAPGTYGINCEQGCSNNCYNNTCNNVTGECNSGCNGYSNPPECTIVCAPGTYGINCQQGCSNNCYNSSCNSVTGECNSGCNGYTNPPECIIVCAQETYGINCQQNCSNNCYNNTCNSVTGECNSGCNGYSNPPECTIVCAPGTYGINCEQGCSNNCYNNTCNSVTCECNSGCNGYSNPPECTIECDRYHWGLNCQQNCSENCYNKTCDKVTGRCDSGCDMGYSNPPDCTLAPPAHGSNTMSFETSIGIGVAVGAGIILLLDALILLIYKFRYSKTVLKESQGIHPKKGTQHHEKNNNERQLQSLGTHSGHYDDFNHLNEYQHFYEKTNNKDAGHEESDPSSKCNHV